MAALNMEPVSVGRLSTAVQDQVASVAAGLGAEEGGGDHAAITRSNKQDPKKRIIMLTAFLACLSFMVVILNAFFSFMYDLVKEDDFWKRLNELAEKVESTRTCMKS